MIFDVQLTVDGTRQAGQGGLAVPWASLALSGGLDLGAAPAALEALLAAGNSTRVVVDFCDSGFVGVADAHLFTRAHGNRLRACRRIERRRSTIASSP